MAFKLSSGKELPLSVIEDTRKVMQDFLAPELREIKARLDALEKRFDESAKHIDQRFDQAEKRADERHQALLLSMTGIANYNEVRDRLLRLELKGTPPSAPATESARQ